MGPVTQAPYEVRPHEGATRAGETSTRVLVLVPLSQNPSRLAVRHMASQQSPEVLMDLLPMIPFLDISAMQLLCWNKEVASSGTGLGSGLRLGLRVRSPAWKSQIAYHAGSHRQVLLGTAGHGRARSIRSDVDRYRQVQP